MADVDAVERAPSPARGGAFDEMAADYDASFGATALGVRLRAMVWERLDEAFSGCRRVLEIGCGTGDDAIHLARRGLEVLATDASPPMLHVAADKAAAAGVSSVAFRCVPMERLGRELDGERFDGVFSNFGAVNCARGGLERVIADVAALLPPGAPLVWVVMGRNVPWEWAWFLARGQWRNAFRRRRKDGVEWRGMRISYPRPADLERALRSRFAPLRRRGLGIVLPPTYAAGWLERSPRALAALLRLERRLQGWQALSAVADHYIFEARRLAERGDA